MYLYAEMPECQTSGQSGTGLKKTNDTGTGPVLDYEETVRHFLVRCRTKIRDAGMPVLVSSMRMPSYIDL
jgi:hypothetical protein